MNIILESIGIGIVLGWAGFFIGYRVIPALLYWFQRRRMDRRWDETAREQGWSDREKEEIKRGWRSL